MTPSTAKRDFRSITTRRFDDDLNEREQTSDYNTNYGLSDEQFRRIQEQMKQNISRDSEEKTIEQAEKSVESQVKEETKRKTKKK